jgi:two-component sensor histidine kinase
VTDELTLRAVRGEEHRSARYALRDLSAQAAADPKAALPRFVALAMEITGASSAGLSIHEPETGTGVFRWTHLHGVLDRFEDATTPRNHSPCGVTLDRNAPVLSRHPERYYEWISDAGIVVPEVLLVPLHRGGDEPLGTLWVVGDERGHFRPDDARILAELAEFIGFALLAAQREARLREELARQELLAYEMDHRVKNLFAITDGMIRMTARGATSTEELAQALSGRVSALARAHALVERRTERGAAGSVRLDDLVATVLNAHGSGATAEGPEVLLGPQAGSGLALALHELATNSAKYGALSRPDGHLAIVWREAGDNLRLDWRESGGPVVEGPPQTVGFGTKLVRRTIEGQLSGTIVFDWATSGLTIEMALRRDKLAH